MQRTRTFKPVLASDIIGSIHRMEAAKRIPERETTGLARFNIETRMAADTSCGEKCDSRNIMGICTVHVKAHRTCAGHSWSHNRK